MTPQVPIGEIATEPTTWDPRESGSTDPFPYIDISSIQADEKRIGDVPSIPRSEAPSRARQLVRAGDVLVSTVRPNLNAVALVPPALDGATVSTGFAVLRPNTARVDSKYLYYWVRTPSFVRAMAARSTGASYPAVTESAVRESRIPLPPLAKQRRIATMLDKADAVRRKRRESLRLLGEFLRAAFLEMFGDPVRNEKGWEVVSLGEIGRVQGGLQVAPAREAYPGKVPYLRVANVYRDRLDLGEVKELGVSEEEAARTALHSGDLLIVEGHGNREEVGRVAVWDGSVQPCVHQNHLIRLRLDRSVAEPVFVSAFLNSSAGRRQMLMVGKTTSGLNTISTSNVKHVRALLPPIEAQRRYVHVRQRVQECRERIMAAEQGSIALFDSLAQQAFDQRASLPETP